jgi:hypothetical protein
MIALCSTCHRHADGGAYTKEQLHQLKKKSPTEPPKGAVPWKTHSAFITWGGNYFLTNKSKVYLIRVAGQELFALRLDDSGYMSINVSIWDKNNKMVLKIERNDILTDMNHLGDLECTAQAKEIRVQSKQNDAHINLRFDRKHIDEILRTIPEFAFNREQYPGLPMTCGEYTGAEIIRLVDSDGLIPTIDISLKIHSQRFEVSTSNKGIRFDMRGLGYDAADFKGNLYNEDAALIFKFATKEIVYLGNEPPHK